MDNFKKYFFASALAGILYLAMAPISLSYAQLSFTNGNFESFSSTSASNASQGGAGIDAPSMGYTTGDALTSWTNSGYAFVYTTTTSLNGGTVTGQDNGFSLWGGANGGLNNITAPPSGGNVVALDGAYEVGPISQALTGLTQNTTYSVTFQWAAAQQSGYTTPTTESFTVDLGAAGLTNAQITSGGKTTTVVDNPAKSFTGWMTQNFTFTTGAGVTTDTLYFLANGTPNGQPPFSLLADVTMVAVPEPLTSSFWTILFGMLIMFGNRAWRRYHTVPAATIS